MKYEEKRIQALTILGMHIIAKEMITKIKKKQKKAVYVKPLS